MSKFGSYIQDSYDELLHKVTWPNASELQRTTTIVVISLAITTLIVLGMDVASKFVLDFIYEMA